MPATPEQQYLSTCPSCDTQIDVTALEPFTKLKCLHCGEMVRVRRKFDHFVIVREIGEGGMSRVFEAEDETLGRRVALKILNRHYSRDAARIEQFRHEALITANVTHPNVIKLYTVGYDQGYFYIAMELVGGGSLEQRIKEAGTVPEADALRIGREVAEGLRAAANAGLIHRDVKPANILFTETGTAKVVDFGLAIFAERGGEASGEIWATPYYVAPEKVIENKEDFRSDIFSLGATMFHALTGKPPHKANTNSLQELKVIKCRRVTLEDSGLRFGAHTHQVVNTMLAFKPEERYQSHGQVIEELRLAEGLMRRPFLRRASQRTRRVIGAAAAVCIAFSLGWMISKSGAKRANSITASAELLNSEVAASEAVRHTGESTVAEKFLKAREVLLEGRFEEGRKLFDEIIAQGAKQPTLNWARFNSALSCIVTGKRETAASLFRQIAEDSTDLGAVGGEELGEFFGKAGRLMGADLGLGADAGKLPFADDNEEIMGHLAFGLAEWHFGSPREGAKSIRRFLAGKPADKGLDWIPRYRVLVEPYLADIDTVLSMKQEKPKTKAEAEAALAEVVEKKAALRTGGTLQDKLGQEEHKLRQSLKRFELETRLQNMADDAERRKNEIKQLRDITESIPSLVIDYDYSPAINLLRDIKFESPEVQSALEGKLYLCEKARDFMQQLAADINAKGCQARIERADASPLEGLVSGADPQGLRLSISRGTVTVPLGAVLPHSLVAMAETFCKQVTDSTDYFRRMELIAAFAQAEDLRDISRPIAAQLMEDNRGFRARWMQVLQGGI